MQTFNHRTVIYRIFTVIMMLQPVNEDSRNPFKITIFGAEQPFVVDKG